MERLVATLGHGRDDPDALDLVAAPWMVRANGIDLAPPEGASGRRVITLALRVTGDGPVAILASIAELEQWIADPQRRSLTLTLGPATGAPRVFDVVAADVEVPPEALQGAWFGTAMPVVLTLTTAPTAAGTPTTVLADVELTADDPISVIDPVGGDRPADLDLTLDDLEAVGLGAVNRWRIATHPLVGTTAASLPDLILPMTDPATADPLAGTLDGQAPASVEVGETWEPIASGAISWTADAPPPEQVVVLTRLADGGSAPPMVDAVRSAAVDGSLAVQQTGEVLQSSLATFGPLDAGALLVVGVQARTTTAMTWPGGWTAQAAVQSGPWRLEVRTRTQATAVDSLSVSVTVSGTDVRTTWAAFTGVAAVSNVQTTSSIATKKGGMVNFPTVVTLPGVGYHATITFYGSEQSFRATGLGNERPSYAVAAGTLQTIGGGAVTRVLGTNDGAMTFDPYAVAGDAGVDNLYGRSVTLTLTASGSAPSVPSGSWDVGVTIAGQDGSESPLVLGEPVRTNGIQALRVAWELRRGAAFARAVRVWWRPATGAWRVLEVAPSTTSVTISDALSGSAGGSPALTARTALMTRVLARETAGAPAAVPLPPVRTLVGDDHWELVPHGLLPLPLRPGGPSTLHVTIEGRAIGGSRRVRVDRVLLLPAGPADSGMVAETTTVQPVPLRWTATRDRDAHAVGITGAAQEATPVGAVLATLPQMDALPAVEAPALFTTPAFASREPSNGFDARPAPGWTTGLAGGANGTTSIPWETVSDPLIPGQPSVARVNNGVTAYGPAMPVTVGQSVTAQLDARLAPSQPAASVRLDIVWYGADGATTVGTAAAGTATAMTTSWQRLVTTGTVPSGAVCARMVVTRASGTGAAHLDNPLFGTGMAVWPRLVTTVADDNPLINPGFDGGAWGWQLAAGASWSSGSVTLGNVAPSIVSSPVLVPGSATVTVSANVTGGGTARLDVRTFTIAGAQVFLHSGVASGTTGRFSGSVTVGATVALVVVEATRSSAGTAIIDNVRLSLSGATDWVAPDPGVAADAASLVIPPPTPDLPTAQTGWLAVRLQSILPAQFPTPVVTRGDGTNGLILDLPSDGTVRLRRITAGSTQTVTTSCPTAGAGTWTVLATWSATTLTLRVHNGTSWSAAASIASTTWPGLDGRDWQIGADGTRGLYGALHWLAAGGNPDGIDAAALAVLDNPTLAPWDLPTATAPAWVWGAGLPATVDVLTGGGAARIAGRLTAAPDRATALVVLGEQADGSWAPVTTRVTAVATPRWSGL